MELSFEPAGKRSTWLAFLARFPLVVGVTAVVFGAVVLASWFQGSVDWMRVRPHLAPVRADVGLGLLLGGAGMLALHFRRRWFASACGVALLAMVLVWMVDHATVTDLTVARLITQSPATGPHSPRMSPETAAAFTMAGVAITALGSGYLVFGAVLLGAFVVTLGGVALIGYAAGTPEVFAWSLFNEMSLLTAVAIVALGAGIMGLGYARAVPRLASVWWSPLVAGFVVGLVAILFAQALSGRQTDQLRELVSATGRAVRGDIEGNIDMRTRTLEYVARRALQDGRSLPEQWDGDTLEILRGSFPGLVSLEWFSSPTAARRLVVLAPGRQRRVTDRGDERLRDALEFSGSRQSPAVVGPLPLLDGLSGFGVVVPLERLDGSTDFVVGVYDVAGALLNAPVRDALGSGVHAVVLAGDEIVYPPVGGVTRGEVGSIDLSLRLPGPQRWSLRVSPTAGLRASTSSQLPELILGMGVLLGLFLAFTAQFAREESIRADAANAAKDSFIMVLGHELRNPLMAIQSAVAIMERNGDDGGTTQREAVGLIRRQLACMSRIVDDLLEASRVASGRLEIERQPLELGRVVEEAVIHRRVEAEGAGVELDLELPDEPVWVEADLTRLHQVMGNLLSNAIKFSDVGDRVDVVVSRHASTDRAVVRVTDHGEGVAPDAMDKIFDPFQHGNGKRSGLGIGLYIAQGFVEAHGGKLTARSRGRGQGSTFAFTIPLSAPSLRREAPGAQPLREKPEEGARVLVIEDHRDSADLLAKLLTMDGYDVEVAHDGASGLELARRELPDVVICDLGLPLMDGYEVARALRQDERTAGIRLVALSGYSSDSAIEKAEEVGFDTHLLKPVEPEVLSRLLASRPPPRGGGDGEPDEGTLQSAHRSTR